MGYELQPIGMPAAWAPSGNSYVWAATCPAAQESTPAQHLRGLGWQRGHAGVPEPMGITAEAAEAMAWAHHLLLMLPWSSTGAGGSWGSAAAGGSVPVSLWEVWWSVPGALVNLTPPALSWQCDLR